MTLLIAWGLLLLGALIAGAAIVGLLVAPPRLEPVAFAIGGVGAATSALGLLSLNGLLGTFGATLLAAFLGLAASVVGYALAAALLPMLARRGQAPRIVAGGEALPSPAYVLLSRAEPSRYSPLNVASVLVALAGQEGPATSGMLAPFLFASQKARYRVAEGSSPARQTVTGLAQRLAGQLHVPEVSVAFCDPPSHLTQVVAGLAARGHRRVVVAPLAVAEGAAEEHAKATLLDARPEESGIDVVYAAPLWSSESLAGLIAERALSFADADPAAAVVLVLEGQPPSFVEEYGDFDQQEASFAGRVATLVTEGGVSPQHVRTAWIDWNTPDVTEAVRHLAALECERVAVVPAVYPTESLTTMLDLARAAELARTEAAVQVLPPWGNDAVVAREIVHAMRAADQE